MSLQDQKLLTPRHSHSSVWLDNKVYLIGGVSSASAYAEGIEVIETTDTEKPVARMMDLKVPRKWPVLTVVSRKDKKKQIFVYGGLDLADQPLNSIEIIEIEAMQSTVVQTQPSFPSITFRMGYLSKDLNIRIFGGPNLQNSINYFDQAGTSWLAEPQDLSASSGSSELTLHDSTAFYLMDKQTIIFADQK